jgi:DNA-binding transcriptional LysR family regulator
MDRLSCDRMFAAVMEAGSFAAAAQRLGTSAGQASKLLARLEGDLGVRLLHRTTRALQPTEAGQTYYARVRALLDDYDALDAEMRDATGAPRGRVRLTAPLSFGTIRLAPILAAFARDNPRIALDVQFTDRLVPLVEEGFDLAVRVGRVQDSTLVARRIGTARLLVVAATDYLRRAGRPQRPEDLAGHACILDTNLREPGRWPFRGGLRVAVTGRLSFSDATACLAAAEAGLGVALSPDFVAERSLAAGRVEVVLADHADDPIPIHALTPSGRHLPAKTRLLVEALARGLREGLTDDPGRVACQRHLAG